MKIVNRDYDSTFEDLLKKDKSLKFYHIDIQEVTKIKGHHSGNDFLLPTVNSVKKETRSPRIFGPNNKRKMQIECWLYIQ